VTPDRIRVFLDADVLARPVTRTLLIAGAPESGFRVLWSCYVEAEANRHLKPWMTLVSDLRLRFGWELSPTGQIGGRFEDTDPKDRQVLADAVAAQAQFIVTGNVDDFATGDLTAASMSAVAPDLFMAAQLTVTGYLEALSAMVVGRKAPPNTRGDVHAAIGRQHPRLFAAHVDLIPGIVPLPHPHDPPRTEFRGIRCMRCTNVSRGQAALTSMGLCQPCLTND